MFYKIYKHERNQEYLDCKRKLTDIFDRNVEGIKIRSNYKCYEEEKNSKFFLNLEKSRAIQSKALLERVKRLKTQKK